METPNLFKRDGGNIIWGTADEIAETLTYNELEAYSNLNVKVVERFTDIDSNGDEFPNANIQLWCGNILKYTIKACPLFIDSGAGVNESYDLQEVLDFFFAP